MSIALTQNRFLKYALGATVACLAMACLGPNSVSAASVNYNNLASDAVFNNTKSMSVKQIDTFLNSFPDSCISSNSGFQARIPTGFNPSSSFSYGNYGTAGQVIYASAQAYGLNPQVLIVTLEKEQSLITGRNNFSGYCNESSQHKYAAVVGYGCPDSSNTYSYSGVDLYRRNGKTVTKTGTTCVNSKNFAGFSQQVIRAAWSFKFNQQRSLGNSDWAIINGPWQNTDDQYSCYSGAMTQGYYQRCPSGPYAPYDGYQTIDGKSVHLNSGATAALYRYTPHFHGNELFVNLFTSWFGSTHYTVRGSIGKYYYANNGSNILGEPAQNEKKDKRGFYRQKFEKGYIAGQGSTGYYVIRGSIGVFYDTYNLKSKLGAPLANEGGDGNGVHWQQFKSGYIIGKAGSYWESLGSIRNSWLSIGGQESNLGLPTSSEIQLHGAGGGWYQRYENGYIIGNGPTGYWESSGPIRDYWMSHGGRHGHIGYPTSSVITTDSGDAYQKYAGGTIYQSEKGGATNVQIIRGSIGNFYDSYDRTSKLGAPLANEGGDGNGVHWQKFENGYIIGKRDTGYYAILDSISSFYGSYGGVSKLGVPLASEDGNGNSLYWQKFENGYVAGQSSTGYYVIRGSIGNFYDSYDGFSRLGAPLANEDGDGTGINWQSFEKGYIIGEGSTGYWESRGSIRDYWTAQGGPTGSLGLPTYSQVKMSGFGGGWYQKYENGYIIGNGNTGYWESSGPIRDYWISHEGRGGVIGYGLGNIITENNGNQLQKYEGGTLRYNVKTGKVNLVS